LTINIENGSSMVDSSLFRDACLKIVLSPSYKERLYGARCCGVYAPSVACDECEAALDKRAQVKESWPGVGALVHAMEDEFPVVRIEGVRSVGKIAEAWPALRDKVSVFKHRKTKALIN
jgi:hypothetical protein